MSHPTRRTFLAAGAAMLAHAVIARCRARPGAPATAGPVDPALIDDLVAANRILGGQGVVDGYGPRERAPSSRPAALSHVALDRARAGDAPTS